MADESIVLISLLRGIQERNGVRGGHGSRLAVIVTHCDWLVIRDSEVNTINCSVFGTLEFAEPLMRHVEVRHHRDGVHTARMKKLISEANTLAANRSDIALRCQVYKYRHSVPRGLTCRYSNQPKTYRLLQFSPSHDLASRQSLMISGTRWSINHRRESSAIST